jgi:hypothetical protein
MEKQAIENVQIQMRQYKYLFSLKWLSPLWLGKTFMQFNVDWLDSNQVLYNGLGSTPRQLPVPFL